jgi:hypothetical protein
MRFSTTAVALAGLASVATAGKLSEIEKGYVYTAQDMHTRIKLTFNSVKVVGEVADKAHQVYDAYENYKQNNQRSEPIEGGKYRIGVPMESEHFQPESQHEEHQPMVARSAVDKTYTMSEEGPSYRTGVVNKTPVNSVSKPNTGKIPVHQRDFLAQRDPESFKQKLEHGAEDVWSGIKVAAKVGSKLGVGAAESVEKRNPESFKQKLEHGAEDVWSAVKVGAKVAGKLGVGAAEAAEKRDLDATIARDEESADVEKRKISGSQVKEGVKVGSELAGDVADASDKIHNAYENWKQSHKRGKASAVVDTVKEGVHLAGDVGDAASKVHDAFESWEQNHNAKRGKLSMIVKGAEEGAHVVEDVKSAYDSWKQNHKREGESAEIERRITGSQIKEGVKVGSELVGDVTEASDKIHNAYESWKNQH